MAASVSVERGGSVPPENKIYRAMNPNHLQSGLPSDNHFVMRQNHAPDDGVSTGISSLIQLAELRSIPAIVKICGESCGAAELLVSEVLAPVALLGISVLQQDSSDWGSFAGAHAVITGYQGLKGNDGRRKIRDFQRHLVKLARKAYFPQGSNTAFSMDVVPFSE
jgi:hypothetical protein